MLITVLWIVISYLFGSVNNSILLSKLFHKTDIREYGSHNAGSTNTLRTFGVKTALAVFILDILKPILPVVLYRLIDSDALTNIPGNEAWLCTVAVIGQCYPIFFQFKGGKGAASAFGSIIVLAPITLPVAIVVFTMVLFISKFVSLSTLIALTAVLIQVFIMYRHSYLIPLVTIGLLMFWRHRLNIKRLLEGTESKVSIKK